MVFPFVDSNQSAIEILDVVIRFPELLGEGTTEALKKLKEIILETDKKSPPKKINEDLKRILQKELPKEEYGIVIKHLPVIFDAIMPLQNIIMNSRQGAGFPAYGDALQKIVRKVHNALHGWNCFDGYPISDPSKFNQEPWMKVMMMDPGVTHHSDGGDIGSKLAKLNLTRAYQTTDKLGQVFTQKTLIDNQARRIYFGAGESNHFLYMFGPLEEKSTPSIKIIFTGHKMLIIPIRIWTIDDFNQKVLQPATAKGLQALTHLSQMAEQAELDGLLKQEELITSVNFLMISEALIEDLIYYSKIIRDENLALLPAKGAEPKITRDSIKDLLRHWLNAFKLSGKSLENAKSKSNLFHSIIGVLIATFITIFIFPLSLAFSSPNWLERTLVNLQMDSPIMTIQVIFFMFVCLIVLIPSGFFLMNGLLYLCANLLGGRGDFVSLNYLTSLIVVPYSLIQLFGFLLLQFGVFGLILGITVMLFLWIFGVNVLLRIMKAIFKLGRRRNQIAVLVPLLIGGVFLISGIRLIAVLIP